MIRHETIEDHEAIRLVNRLAFGQEDEARLVDALRLGGYTRLSLVAEVDSVVVGHILFSDLPILTDSGIVSALALAPMAVLPAFQRQGIGSKLVETGLAVCREQGHRIVVVLGHSHFYPRFGFSAKLTEPLESPFSGSDSWMTLELVPGALANVRGRVQYAPPFGIAESFSNSEASRRVGVTPVRIVQADLANGEHQSAILQMMNEYSEDPMGDGRPLSHFAKANLIAGLQSHPTTIVFLAFLNEVPCGIATCFRGFSTFAAKPLINISDYYVVPSRRGSGIGTELMKAMEKEGRRLGCCKLTLEVQQNNTIAREVYGRFGFKQAVYAADANGGGSLYMVKPLVE